MRARPHDAPNVGQADDAHLDVVARTAQVLTHVKKKNKRVRDAKQKRSSRQNGSEALQRHRAHKLTSVYCDVSAP